MAEPMKIRAGIKGDVAEIKCLMNHTMETGLRKDAKTGGVIPAHHITNVTAKLNGLPTPEPFFANTCFSITDDDWGFSVVHVYRLQDGKLVYIKEAGGISPVKMDSEEGLKLQRKLEAEYAVGWLKNIMTDAFA
ncbi:MAG: FCSD flavin-binding domain-containing protein [Rhodoferax sp.]|nr:FCSD flavin-binding domain-containing protein [Rhodoferax sp.]